MLEQDRISAQGGVEDAHPQHPLDRDQATAMASTGVPKTMIRLVA